MARRKIHGARAMVTGASSGIGQELARQLAQAGAKLLLTARREERLRRLCDELRSAGHEARFLVGDITEGSVRQQLFHEARSTWGALDILVNNAGLGAVGPFAAASESRLRRVMEVNFFAPLELIRATLPLLQAGRRPIVVNVGSVLGHRGVPHKSEYCASKFALHGFSDAIRAEWSSLGIDVLLVSPSTTRSEFFDRALMPERAPAKYSPPAMPAAVVARKTLRAMQRGSHEIILSPGGKLLVWLDRLCPPLMNRIVARFGQAMKGDTHGLH